MADDEVAIRVRLKELQKFVADTKRAGQGVEGIGRSARITAASARVMSGALSTAGRAADRTMGAVWNQSKRGGIALGILGAATTKWGLGFNAQIESAQLRFELFTKSQAQARQVLRGVQAVDLNSAFNLADLADTTALLGNSGRSVGKLPRDLRAIANAAAASGKGLPALQGISIALAQIQAKGKLSQEEINQLNEAGAPGAQRIIQKAFGLTADQVGNLGGQGLDATKAIDALVKAWTSGRMANAARKQTTALGGQWALLTGNAQKASGALTAGMAKDLEHTVLPAANRAASAITDIFNRTDLTTEQKLRAVRRVIEREMGPIAQDLEQRISDADIPRHLGDAVEKALPVVAGAAADVAKEGAKAFVSAWLNSGPEAQVLVALILGKKLGAGKLIGKGLGGIGGGGGSPLGALAGRGASPANPVFVKDVGGNIDSGGKVPKWVPPWLKVAGPAGATAFILDEQRRAAREAGIPQVKPTGSFATDAPSQIALGDKIARALGLGSIFRQPQAAPPQVHDPAVVGGLAAGPFSLEAPLRLVLGDKVVAEAVVHTQIKRRARKAGG